MSDFKSLMNKIDIQMKKDLETESWQKNTLYHWQIARSAPLSYWLSGEFSIRSKENPNGMTLKTAKAIAGKRGQIFRVTTIRERIQ